MKGKIRSEKLINEFKLDIAAHVSEFVRASGLEQQVVAKKLGFDPALMSLLIRGRLEGFTIDRLLKFLGTVRPDLVPVLKKKRTRKVK